MIYLSGFYFTLSSMAQLCLVLLVTHPKHTNLFSSSSFSSIVCGYLLSIAYFVQWSMITKRIYMIFVYYIEYEYKLWCKIIGPILRKHIFIFGFSFIYYLCMLFTYYITLSTLVGRSNNRSSIRHIEAHSQIYITNEFFFFRETQYLCIYFHYSRIDNSYISSFSSVHRSHLRNLKQWAFDRNRITMYVVWQCIGWCYIKFTVVWACQLPIFIETINFGWFNRFASIAKQIETIKNKLMHKFHSIRFNHNETQ